jgi:hypothetical protein
MPLGHAIQYNRDPKPGPTFSFVVDKFITSNKVIIVYNTFRMHIHTYISS